MPIRCPKGDCQGYDKVSSGCDRTAADHALFIFKVSMVGMQGYSKALARVQEAAAATREPDTNKILLTNENDKTFVASAMDSVDKRVPRHSVCCAHVHSLVRPNLSGLSAIVYLW
jgi:hypothetical protein